jgi:SPP1 family predicted phage head-tail adaptor
MPSRRNVAYVASGRKRSGAFQLNTSGRTPDGQGGHSKNWTTVTGLANVPLDFLTWSPYQMEVAQQSYPGVTSRATMRYRKSAPVTAAMRLVVGTHIYKVRASMNYDESDEIIQVYLEELQAVGSSRT